MNKKQALAVVVEIESLIQGFGLPDKDALRTVSTHTRSLGYCQHADANFTEQLGKLEEWCKIGFSSRKFEKYSGGAREIRGNAIAACMTLKRLIKKWPDPAECE